MYLITIFTDGSSRGNPGPGGWAAIAIYPKANEEMRVDELGGRVDHTTNNKMEMTAALQALRYFEDFYQKGEDVEYIIYTDSAYLVNGITAWVHGWQRNGWLTSAKEAVLNADLWKELVNISRGKKISWRQVKGHADTPGNNRCDEIATSFADNRPTELYKGSSVGYGIDIISRAPVAKSSGAHSQKSSSSSKKPAYSYVSMVGGNVETHSTWAETEKRVKGKSGARFKKALNKAQEEEIIQEFKQ